MCVAESQEEREHEHGSFSINFHGCGHVASTTHDMHVVTNTRPASALLFCQFSFDKSQPVSQSTAVKINKSYISLCCRGVCVCVYSINYRSTCIRAGWWKWLALCECLCSVCVLYERLTHFRHYIIASHSTFFLFLSAFVVCVCFRSCLQRTIQMAYVSRRPFILFSILWRLVTLGGLHSTQCNCWH